MSEAPPVAPSPEGEDTSPRPWPDERDTFRLLIDGVRDYAIYMLDPSGRILTWNDGGFRLKGYRAQEIIGQHLSIFYTPEDAAGGKAERELDAAAREGRFEDEGWRVRKDGSRFWANVVVTAIYDERGAVRGFAKITRDLTERKRIQDEQTARVAAERANQIKDEFLAMLGHELRNPLAPIVTALQLMKLRDPGRDVKERGIIERQVKHMVRLIDDLLDVARITRGKFQIEKKVVDVRDVIARAVETVSPLLEQKGHYLDVEVPDQELSVDGDDARLVQVCANLLTNAAKYTPPGGHLTVAVAAADQDIIIQVKDDGTGIAPDLLPKIFALFVQGEQGKERSTGGLGIGLALARTLVQLHGGTIEAASAGVGLGSTFTVRLPRSQSQRALHSPTSAARAPPRDTGQLRKVLVVDDNRDALELVAEVLQEMGYEVRTATDGPSAMEIVKVFKPEVAVLDIGLPVMDGYELATRLCEDMGPARPRLVALTGYGQSHDRARSLQVGFDAHLVKPINVQALVESIGGSLKN